MSSPPPARFATRPNLGFNRPAAIWFVRRFLAPDAEILYLPSETIAEQARAAGATVFHAPGFELHMDKERERTTLDALLDRYGWRGRDPALDLVAEIVNDASYRLGRADLRHPAAVGLKAIYAGLRLTHPADEDRLPRALELYDALHAWAGTRTGFTPRG